jgi:hypothetical protein
VALLGPDGAGKSTLVAGLTHAFVTDARIIYLGFGISGGQSRPPLLARLRLPVLGAPGRLLVLWDRFLRACFHQTRGRLVLFDRYTFDALAPPPGRRSWLRRISPWIKARACPVPDLVVVLDVPGTVMFQPKAITFHPVGAGACPDCPDRSLEGRARAGRSRRTGVRLAVQRHWQLDVTFAEDGNRVQRRQGAQNLALLRRLALTLLQRHGGKESMACKRYMAALDPAFLEEILVAGCNSDKA